MPPMMPITRQEIEVLLDTPLARDYIVSAYVDLTVKDGFRDFAEKHLKNQAKAAETALSQAGARKALGENMDLVHRALAELHEPGAKGAAIFVSKPRGIRHVVPLDFPVEN